MKDQQQEENNSSREKLSQVTEDNQENNSDNPENSSDTPSEVEDDANNSVEVSMNIPEQDKKEEKKVLQMIEAEEEPVNINVKASENEKSDSPTSETETDKSQDVGDAREKAVVISLVGEEETATSEEAGIVPEMNATEEIETIVSADKKDEDHTPALPQSADDTDGEDDTEQEEDRDEEMEELESSEHYADLEPEEVIARMEELAKEQDPEPVRKKFFALRKSYFDNRKQERDLAYQTFINEGGAVEDYEMPASTPNDEKLREITTLFKGKLTEKREKREKEKHENLQAKRQVIEDLKAVIQNEANILHAFDKIHELQAKWRSIGIVPLDQAEDLWQSYRFYVGKFYDLIRIHKELQELDQKKNLEAKVALCGQAEDLLLEDSINKAITQLRELQDKWRDIGPVPRENNEEIWDRFKAAADKIYDRRRTHIESLRGEQEANLVKKAELCERAEKLNEQKPDKPGEWQKVTDELKQLQQEWRKIGPAPRQHNEKIWQRFRDAGDKHFNDKKEYFSTLKREQDINKQKKTDICVQAESLKDSTEWRETANALKNLQEEWKSIGPVHPKYSQKLWERFRAACDAFFSQRSEHHSEQDKEYTENLNLKTALVEEIEKFEPTENKSKDLEKLKEAQKKWSEIGRVPIKVKDKIYQRYRSALDKCYEKLNLSVSDRRNITSNNRIQQIEQEDRQLSPKDKSSVRYKIDKLQDEIRLLENNIGFFANSGKANKLKEDYEKKIEKAKDEVNSLKALLSKS